MANSTTKSQIEIALGLRDNIPDLIARFNQLAAKTRLSAKELEQLQNIIKNIDAQQQLQMKHERNTNEAERLKNRVSGMQNVLKETDKINVAQERLKVNEREYLDLVKQAMELELRRKKVGPYTSADQRIKDESTLLTVYNQINGVLEKRVTLQNQLNSALSDAQRKGEADLKRKQQEIDANQSLQMQQNKNYQDINRSDNKLANLQKESVATDKVSQAQARKNTLEKEGIDLENKLTALQTQRTQNGGASDKQEAKDLKMIAETKKQIVSNTEQQIKAERQLTKAIEDENKATEKRHNRAEQLQAKQQKLADARAAQAQETQKLSNARSNQRMLETLGIDGYKNGKPNADYRAAQNERLTAINNLTEAQNRLANVQDRINQGKLKGLSAVNAELAAQENVVKRTKELTAAEENYTKAKKAVLEQNAKGGKLDNKKASDLDKVKRAQLDYNRTVNIANAVEPKNIKTKEDLIRAINRVNNGLNALSRAGKNTSKEYAELSIKSKELRKRLSEIKDETNKSESAFGKLGKRVKGVALNFAIWRGVNYMFSSFGNILSNIFSKTIEFEKAQSKLKSVLGATTQEMELLNRQARYLGQTTIYTAKQVVELQTELSKLGFKADSINMMTGSVLRLAAACDTDLASASKVAGSVIKMFGANAAKTEEYVASLAVATTKSALTFSDYESALSQIGPTGRALGLNLQEVLAVFGAVRDSGFTASTAATALRTAFVKLSGAGKEMRNFLGFRVKDYDTLKQALLKIRDANLDLASTFQLADTRSVSAFKALLNNVDQLDKRKQVITDVTNEFREMYRVMTDNVAGSLTKLSSAYDDLMLSFQNSKGTWKSVIDWTSELVQNISNSLKDAKQLWDWWEQRNENEKTYNYEKLEKRSSNRISYWKKNLSMVTSDYMEVLKDQIQEATGKVFEQMTKESQTEALARQLTYNEATVGFGKNAFKEGSVITNFTNNSNRTKTILRNLNSRKNELLGYLTGFRDYSDTEFYNMLAERLGRDKVFNENGSIRPLVDIAANIEKELEINAAEVAKWTKTDQWWQGLVGEGKYDEIAKTILPDKGGSKDPVESLADKIRKLHAETKNKFSLAKERSEIDSFEKRANQMYDEYRKNYLDLQKKYGFDFLYNAETVEQYKKEFAGLPQEVKTLYYEMRGYLKDMQDEYNRMLSEATNRFLLNELQKSNSAEIALMQLRVENIDKFVDERLKSDAKSTLWGNLLKRSLAELTGYELNVRERVEEVKRLKMSIMDKTFSNSIASLGFGYDFNKSQEDNIKESERVLLDEKMFVRKQTETKIKEYEEALNNAIEERDKTHYNALLKIEREALKELDNTYNTRYAEIIETIKKWNTERRKLEVDSEKEIFTARINAIKTSYSEIRSAIASGNELGSAIIDVRRAKAVMYEYHTELKKFSRRNIKLIDSITSEQLRSMSTDELLKQLGIDSDTFQKITGLDISEFKDSYAEALEELGKTTDTKSKAIFDVIGKYVDVLQQGLQMAIEAISAKISEVQRDYDLLRQRLDNEENLNNARREREIAANEYEIAQINRAVNEGTMTREQASRELAKLSEKDKKQRLSEVATQEAITQKRIGLEVEEQAKIKELKETQKKLTLVNIWTNYAQSIANAILSATRTSAETPLGAFMMPALIASMVASTIGAFASTFSALEQANAYAEGGLITGAGTGTSDSIVARVSNGESVNTARATSMFAPLLSSANQIGGGRPIQTSDVSSQAEGQKFLADAFAQGVKELPNPIVGVTDIARVQKRVQVIDRLGK